MFRDRSTRRRYRLARSLERAAVPERRHIGCGPSYLVQPEITAACTPSLRAIAAALRDEPAAFDDEELRVLERFVLDGRSPFFGRDATAAMREAVRLQHAVLGAKAASRKRGNAKPVDGVVPYPSPVLTGR